MDPCFRVDSTRVVSYLSMSKERLAANGRVYVSLVTGINQRMLGIVTSFYY